MDFNSLGLFFSNNYQIVINTEDLVEVNDFIRINSISSSNRVDFSYDDRLSFRDSTKNFSGYVSNNYKIQLENIIDTTHDYFAKTISFKKGVLILNVYVVDANYDLDTKIEIGYKLNDMSIEAFMKEFEDKFIIKIGKARYYLYAKYIVGNANVFSIVNDSYKYDIILTKRDGLEDSKYDTIFAINSNYTTYEKDKYFVQLKKVNFEFKDCSKVGIATEENKLFLRKNIDNNIVSYWRKFSDKDYEISMNYIMNAGRLYFELEQSSDYADDANKEKYCFNILNVDDIFKFSEGIKNLGGMVELVIVVNEDNERENIKLLYEGLSGDKLYCISDQNLYNKDLYGTYIKISDTGVKLMHQRRDDAITRILSSRAAKVNLLNLMAGESSRYKENKKKFNIKKYIDKILPCFNGETPDEYQLQAIEMAVNTPDFCIIQGPPGCGKTSILQAIEVCLKLADSGEHRYGSDVSTAYQNESTKNINDGNTSFGIPIPYLNNKKSKEEVEKNFIDYFEKIAEGLRKKYPDIIAEINYKEILNYVSSLSEKIVEDSTTISELANLLTNFKKILINYDNEVNKAKFLELEKRARFNLDNILKKKVNQTYYFIKQIPTCIESFEDDGLNLFEKIDFRVGILNEKFEPIFAAIKKEYANNPIDFKKVKQYKNELIYIEKSKDYNIIDKKLNKEVLDLLEKMYNELNYEQKNNSNFVLKNYIDNILNNLTGLRSAIIPWITNIAATHQICGDAKLLGIYDDYNIYNNVLIDEAARSCPPDLFIPLSCAKNRIIMVGDHRQLPQFVNDEVLDQLDFEKEIKNDMKNVSIFEKLIDSVKKLEKEDGIKRFITIKRQYRMPKFLGDFVSKEFYESDKKNKVVLESFKQNKDNDESLANIPYIDRKYMVWCDVDGRSTKDNHSYINENEVEVITKLVEQILNSDKKVSIGVVSFYKAQINEIRKKIKTLSGNNMSNEVKNRVLIDTVDAFQGLQKDIMILSTVKSEGFDKFNPKSFGFLKNMNRLCVAMSRQKKCLIVVGDKTMFNTDVAEIYVKPLADCVKLCYGGNKYAKYISKTDIK